MTTLRDALSDALSKAEEGNLVAPVETPIEADVHQEQQTEAEDRARDDKGRFAQAQKQEAQPQEVEPLPEPAQPKKAPSSWKKDYWGQWEKLDPTLQNYLEEREGQYAKGVSTYKNQWDQAAPIIQAMQPFLPELQQHGIAPQQWIANLGHAHRTLALGTPEQKVQMFAKLATDYGVDINAFTGQQANPQFGHVTQTVGNLQQQVQNLINQQKHAEQSSLLGQIEQFKLTAPHFEEVRETMGRLLDSGVAEDLKTAYDKAIRLHDNIWQQEQQAKRQATVTQKKAAAVSPKSTSPTGSMSAGNTKKSLRDTLSEQFDEVSSGRF